MTPHSTVVQYPHDSWRIGYYRWMMTPMWKSVRIRIPMAVLALIFRSGVLHAQMPFYTDDPSVTPTKYDGLQSS